MVAGTLCADWNETPLQTNAGETARIQRKYPKHSCVFYFRCNVTFSWVIVGGTCNPKISRNMVLKPATSLHRPAADCFLNFRCGLANFLSCGFWVWALYCLHDHPRCNHLLPSTISLISAPWHPCPLHIEPYCGCREWHATRTWEDAATIIFSFSGHVAVANTAKPAARGKLKT